MRKFACAIVAIIAMGACTATAQASGADVSAQATKATIGQLATGNAQAVTVAGSALKTQTSRGDDPWCKDHKCHDDHGKCDHGDWEHGHDDHCKCDHGDDDHDRCDKDHDHDKDHDYDKDHHHDWGD
jgi:hypothetical protein